MMKIVMMMMALVVVERRRDVTLNLHTSLGWSLTLEQELTLGDQSWLRSSFLSFSFSCNIWDKKKDCWSCVPFKGTPDEISELVSESSGFLKTKAHELSWADQVEFGQTLTILTSKSEDTQVHRWIMNKSKDEVFRFVWSRVHVLRRRAPRGICHLYGAFCDSSGKRLID